VVEIDIKKLIHKSKHHLVQVKQINGHQQHKTNISQLVKMKFNK
jgi:hypothetical protein